jgi:LAO/AO transport system kinase
VVVSAPGLGDEIQAIKAGMLEIADVHVVSKCDRSDAIRTLTDLKGMLTLGALTSKGVDWQTPVIGVSSYDGSGFDDLLDALARHRRVALGTDYGRRRRVAIAQFRLEKTAENLLMERFARSCAPLSLGFAERLQRHEGDPYSLAGELVAASFGKEQLV